MPLTGLRAGALAAAACTIAAPALAQDEQSAGSGTQAPETQGPLNACLITKTDTNPFFAKMKEGARKKAKELGIELTSYAGRFDGDNETQVEAVETCIADGAEGILLTPSDSKAMVGPVREAREAGALVIALDTPLQPIDAADATFATDNFEAGRLIGEWARKTLGEKAEDAKVAFLDLHESQPSVGLLRDQGFMTGFGIDPKDESEWGDEDDPRIVGHEVTSGAEDGGRTGMENLLLKEPDIDVVYSINEPAAAGAYEAMKAFGATDALLVAIDGGCPGVQNVEEGVIGATSQQYPLLMASKGMEAIKDYTETGKIPEPSEGLDFFNTGVNLVTDAPVEGIDNISVEEGQQRCWG